MSRYPSAYGHTPSYRSVGSMPVYPSALGARDSDLSFRTSSGLGATAGAFSSGLGSSALSSEMDREFASMKASLKADSLLADPIGLSRANTSASSAYKSSSYSHFSSSEVRSSADGGIPHRSSNSDSMYKSTSTGNPGIPHTSYSHTSSSFDTDRPYGNRVSSFSYNI